MRYLILLTLVFPIWSLSGCAHRTKRATIDLQCTRLLNQALQLQHKQANKARDYIAVQAANLITGAKIAREHRAYMQCLDKSGRAVKLLDPDAKLAVQVNN